ncbi:autotransporter outer membrane beta-barrel domain-containing protein [Methylovorus glucosotrophus]|nr:autotransporter outer membrane beta-barrel domain-containing protein [Methylovorus glucosotrophus]
MNRKILLAGVLLASSTAYADCVDNGAGTYSCTGTSTNTDTLTGEVAIDTSGGSATLVNTESGSNRGVIQNDSAAAGTGAEQTINVTGGSAATVTNSHGAITYTRNDLDSALFSASASGILLYNGGLAGIGAAVLADGATPSLTVNNDNYASSGTNNTEMTASGSFTAVIYGSAPQIVINNNGIIRAQDHASGADTLSNGRWALATYGGASYTAPSILDGTQYATVTSAGLTQLNNQGYMVGDVLVVDRNPLLDAAKALDSSLVLTYDSANVGPRDSIINNTNYGGVATGGYGTIIGNIYLGSGAHVINNGSLDGQSAGSSITGNIYVDQRASAVTSVVNGVETTEYLVAGARTFTFNQMGQFDGSITIHDVASSVNNINVYAGLSDNVSQESSNPNFDIITDGLGVNNLNIYCMRPTLQCSGAGGNWTGLTELNILGSRWDFSDATKLIDMAGGDINIDATQVKFGGTMIADTVTVNTALIGVLATSPDAINEDSIGTITGHLINNGAVIVRDATLTVNGDTTFNSGSVLSLRINSAGNGGLSVVGGQGTFASDSTVVVSAKDYYFRTGDTFTIATNSSGAPVIIGPGAIVNLSSSDNTGDLILTARVGIPDYLSVTTAGNNAVNVLMNYSGSDSGLVSLQQEIQALGAEDLKRAAERLRPEVNDSLVRMTLQHSDRVLGLVESHLFDTYLAQLKGEPRVPVDGKLPSGAGIWFQGFGGIGTQDTRNNVDGYTGTSTGMAAGMDRLVGSSDKLRAGFAGAYAYGNIDNRGYTDAHRTNINSYMGLVYGAWNADPWYVNGALGLARNTYATERIALGQSAEANHESWQFSAKVDAGWPLMINDLLTVVPMGMLSYNRINEDGYTEKGTNYGGIRTGVYSEVIVNDTDSAINLRIGRKTYDSYRAGLGGKVLLNIQQPDYNAGVELRAQLVHEFGDLTNNSVAQFTHGGPVFYSPGIRPARDTLVLGSSVRLTGSDANDQLTLLASLDAELREQYFGQAMTLMLRYDFDQGPSYEKKASYRKAAALVRQQATRAVQATDRDIARLSQAMTAKNTDLMDELLAADLKSTDPAVRADAEKRQAVKVAIDNWINAMLNGNSQVYFNSYAADYVNEEGLTRSQWEQKRRRELKEGANTAMHIADLTIEAEGTRASTVFTQTSLQNNQPKKVQKVIELEQRNGRWLILSEDNVPLDN